MSLNLFPARIPTGRFRGPDGKDVDVFATPEFFRALSDVFARLGGGSGIANDELALFSILAPVASIAAPDTSNVFDQGSNQSAITTALERSMEEVRQLAASVSTLSAEVHSLRQAAASAEMNHGDQDQFRVNWERPGRIGVFTASTGAFTTLSASGQITSTLATGTAPLVIASTTNIPNLNASSLNGATFSSPGAIGGTAQNTIHGSSFKCPFGGTLLGLTASSYLVQAETAAIVRSYSVGPDAGTYGSHEHYAATSTPATQLVYTATSAGFKVSLAFGCNGAAPQTAVASGAALAAYAGGANGLSIAADMQSLVDKVIAIDAALKANGIFS